MPLNVKKAIVSLIISFIFMLIADYLNWLHLEGYDFFDPIIFFFIMIWAVIIAWIIFRIFKKENVVSSLYGISLIMSCLLVREYMHAGLAPSQISHFFEIVFLLLPVYFLKTTSSKLWFEEKNS